MAEKNTVTKKAATTKKATSENDSAKKVAVKASTTVKAPKKKTIASKSSEAEFYINSYTAGFRAGDVYQALASAGKALSVVEIAKAAKISTEEVYLGIGWLFKEGKVKDENNLMTLA